MVKIIDNANSDSGIPVLDYIEENVSSKVVKIIQSYAGVVNEMVWEKTYEYPCNCGKVNGGDYSCE